MQTFEEWFDGWDGWKNEEERHICKIMMRVTWDVACKKATLAERERCAELCKAVSKDFDQVAAATGNTTNIVHYSDGAMRCFYVVKKGFLDAYSDS